MRKLIVAAVFAGIARTLPAGEVGKGVPWRTPRPPYPREAMAAGAQGQGVIRVWTNGSGRVEKVEIVKKIHPLLDAHLVAMARAHWTGPPNTTRDVPVSYQLK